MRAGCWSRAITISSRMLFASSATCPSLVLVREVESMSSAELAVLLLAALSACLADLLDSDAPAGRSGSVFGTTASCTLSR